jgi:hypothetical protein
MLAGAAAGVAGAAVIGLRRPAQPVEAVAAAAVPRQKDATDGRGYHETAHIRKYYDTTKV